VAPHLGEFPIDDRQGSEGQHGVQGLFGQTQRNSFTQNSYWYRSESYGHSEAIIEEGLIVGIEMIVSRSEGGHEDSGEEPIVKYTFLSGVDEGIIVEETAPLVDKNLDP